MFLKIIGAIAIGFLIVVLRAVVTQDLWLWFLVPLGLPEIGFAHAGGMGLAVMFIAGVRDMPPKDQSGTETVISAFLFVVIAWLAGAFWHSFM